MKDGLPFHGTKSDILKSILPKCGDEAPPDSADSVKDQKYDSFDIYIVDLSVQIRAKASARESLDKNMTYRQFCLSIINGAVNSAKIVGAKRLDLVADMYQSHSIKGPTRNKRGKCTGIKVSADDILPRRNKLDQYLTNDDLLVIILTQT